MMGSFVATSSYTTLTRCVEARIALPATNR